MRTILILMTVGLLAHLTLANPNKFYQEAVSVEGCPVNFTKEGLGEEHKWEGILLTDHQNVVITVTNYPHSNVTYYLSTIASFSISANITFSSIFEIRPSEFATSRSFELEQGFWEIDISLYYVSSSGGSTRTIPIALCQYTVDMPSKMLSSDSQLYAWQELTEAPEIKVNLHSIMELKEKIIRLYEEQDMQIVALQEVEECLGILKHRYYKPSVVYQDINLLTSTMDSLNAMSKYHKGVVEMIQQDIKKTKDNMLYVFNELPQDLQQGEVLVV